MGKRIVEEASLVSVANKIRERAGTSEPLVFPEGFKSAVEGIPDNLENKINDLIEEYESEGVAVVTRFGFAGSRKVTKLSFPNATKVQAYGLYDNNKLVDVYLPKVTEIDSNAFESCTVLKKLDLPSLTVLQPRVFGSCGVETIILRAPQVCRMYSSTTINAPAITNGTGFIYVPKNLESAYKADTNWSNYSSQIRAIEDYPEITGGAV